LLLKKKDDSSRLWGERRCEAPGGNGSSSLRGTSQWGREKGKKKPHESAADEKRICLLKAAGKKSPILGAQTSTEKEKIR